MPLMPSFNCLLFFFNPRVYLLDTLVETYVFDDDNSPGNDKSQRDQWQQVAVIVDFFADNKRGKSWDGDNRGNFKHKHESMLAVFFPADHGPFFKVGFLYYFFLTFIV